MLTKNDTNDHAESDNLPMVIAPAQPRAGAFRYALPSSFASQLIAARDRMGIQRARRLTSAPIATSAYRTSSTIAVKRMPAGYIRSLSV